MKNDSDIKKIDSFNKDGFIIQKLFNKKIIEKYKKKILNNLKKSAKKKNIKSIKSLIKLEDYFSIINSNDHNKLMDRDTRTIKIDSFDEKIIIQNHLKPIFNYFSEKDFGIYRNKNTVSWKGRDIKNYAGFRIVKPNSKKVAGFHSDHYNLKDFRFTLWVPLIGFTKKYTLKMIPASHLKKHLNTVTEKNPNGTAKLIKKSYISKFKKPIRPNLRLGEAILFHPYLIHGNAKNLGKKLRASMEIRIGKKN